MKVYFYFYFLSNQKFNCTDSLYMKWHWGGGWKNQFRWYPFRCFWLLFRNFGTFPLYLKYLQFSEAFFSKGSPRLKIFYQQKCHVICRVDHDALREITRCSNPLKWYVRYLFWWNVNVCLSSTASAWTTISMFQSWLPNSAPLPLVSGLPGPLTLHVLPPLPLVLG